MKHWFSQSLRHKPVIADAAAVVGGAIFPLSLSPFDFWLAAPASVLLLYFSVSGSAVVKRPVPGSSVSEHPVPKNTVPRSPVSETSLLRISFRFYLYNLFMFGFGVSWVYVSIHDFGGASPALAASLVLLLVCAYALIAVPQGFLYARYLRSGVLVSLVGFSTLWVLQEWFRSWFLTGFPWLFVGYGFIDTPLAGYAPFFGVFGVSLVVVLTACLVFDALRRHRLMLLLPVVILLAAGFMLDAVRLTKPERLISVSLVQGNVDQHTKWDRGNAAPILDRYLTLTGGEWGRDLIVWPEAALTLFRHRAVSILKSIADKAYQHGSTLLLGIPDLNEYGGYQNTVIALGAGSGRYVKRRLVPFGEYVPLEDHLRGIIDFLDLPMSRNQPGLPGQAPLVAGDLRLSTSICYEVVYPDLVRTTVRLPDLLVTISNDAWFGESVGPWQHLQMARMRALENGRSMVRATNNGITAVIDARGRLLDTLPQHEQGVLRSEIAIHSGETPFHRFGHQPVLLLCAVGLFLAMLGNRRHRARRIPASKGNL